LNDQQAHNASSTGRLRRNMVTDSRWLHCAVTLRLVHLWNGTYSSLYWM